MIVTKSDLKPLQAEIFQYHYNTFKTRSLEECSLSYFIDHEIILLDDTVRVEEDCTVLYDDITLTFDVAIKNKEPTYCIEIPIFLFNNQSSITRYEKRQHNSISIDNSGITVYEINNVTVTYYGWNDMISINKTILGKSWKYWIEMCGFQITNELL